MRRRDFIKGIAGSAVALPLTARAQQRVRRIGVLMSTSADDALGHAWNAAFAQGVQQLGWEVGRNVQNDTRWGRGDTERFRKYAAELVALAPDVLVGTAASIVHWPIAHQTAGSAVQQKRGYSITAAHMSAFGTNGHGDRVAAPGHLPSKRLPMRKVTL